MTHWYRVIAVAAAFAAAGALVTCGRGDASPLPLYDGVWPSPTRFADAPSPLQPAAGSWPFPAAQSTGCAMRPVAYLIGCATSNLRGGFGARS